MIMKKVAMTWLNKPFAKQVKAAKNVVAYSISMENKALAMFNISYQPCDN